MRAGDRQVDRGDLLGDRAEVALEVMVRRWSVMVRSSAGVRDRRPGRRAEHDRLREREELVEAERRRPRPAEPPPRIQRSARPCTVVHMTDASRVVSTSGWKPSAWASATSPAAARTSRSPPRLIRGVGAVEALGPEHHGEHAGVRDREVDVAPARGRQPVRARRRRRRASPSWRVDRGDQVAEARRRRRRRAATPSVGKWRSGAPCETPARRAIARSVRPSRPCSSSIARAVDEEALGRGLAAAGLTRRQCLPGCRHCQPGLGRATAGVGGPHGSRVADGPMMRAPFEVHGTPPVPVVATAIHAGHDLRSEVRSLLALDEATRRREEDPFTEVVARGVDAHVVVHRSRFEVDLNRSRDECVYLRPDDSWGLEVWSDEPPPTTSWSDRRECTTPSTRSMARLLDPLAARGPFVVLDVHSYNHRRVGPDAAPAPPADEPRRQRGHGLAGPPALRAGRRPLRRRRSTASRVGGRPARRARERPLRGRPPLPVGPRAVPRTRGARWRSS